MSNRDRRRAACRREAEHLRRLAIVIQARADRDMSPTPETYAVEHLLVAAHHLDRAADGQEDGR